MTYFFSIAIFKGYEGSKERVSPWVSPSLLLAEKLLTTAIPQQPEFREPLRTNFHTNAEDRISFAIEQRDLGYGETIG